MLDDPTTQVEEPTLGELVQRATNDLSTLVRQEIELAKVEIKRDVAAAGKGAGMFGGAGLAGLLALVMLSVAAAFGIAEALDTWAGFLIVGTVYLLLAAVLALSGKKAVQQIGPPQHTIDTVKDDLAWAKHPTVTPARTSGRHSKERVS